MPREEKNYIRSGALGAGMFTGAIGYSFYRKFIKQEFLRAEGSYKLEQRVQNCTPWKQLYFTWWRMPDEEWMVYHRFKPYYILGQLDQSKEVLIPRKKNGADGFDVINPIYCYEGGKLSMNKTLNLQNDAVSIDRSAIIVNRGWVPAAYRDKRSRPNEVNSRQLVRLTGCWFKGKNIHDYKVPNNPDNNEWNNLCLEDIGIYWDLPNWDEARYYYFNAVQLVNEEDLNPGSPVRADSRDEVIEKYYEWRFTDETLYKRLYQGFGAASAFSFALGFIAL